MSKKQEPSFVDVDTMLSRVGDFGRYQKILIVLFCFINVLSAFHYFGQTFISVIPEFECQRPIDLNRTDISVSQCSLTLKTGSETIEEPCTHWEYNNSYGFVSIVEEVSLDNSSLQRWYKSGGKLGRNCNSTVTVEMCKQEKLKDDWYLILFLGEVCVVLLCFILCFILGGCVLTNRHEILLNIW